MWLLILIVVVLLLRAIATSKTAASVPMATKTVCSAPTAGDSFTQGNTIAAGVPEPPTLHCQHISRGPIVYSGLPIHVTYPVAPPPIKITNPAQPAPAPISPKFGAPQPILSYPKTAPMPVRTPTRPIYSGSVPLRRPMAMACSCMIGIGGGGFGGGGTASCCHVSYCFV